MPIKKLFEPKPGERRALVPQFLAKGADRAPQSWDKRSALRHAQRRMDTIVPTLTLTAWLKKIDVIQTDTVNVRGAFLQDQHGTSAVPALHLAWGTPWLNNFTLWDRAYNFLPAVGRDGHRVAMEAAKWSARTELGPWGVNYGDFLMEEAGKRWHAAGQSASRLGLAAAISFVMLNQKTGQSLDREVIRHGLALAQAGISQATDIALETIGRQNLLAFYEFVTSSGIAPRVIDTSSGRELNLIDVVDEAESEYRPAGYIRKASHYDYSDEGVERERTLWFPPLFREHALETIEATEKTNSRPPMNMSSNAVTTLETRLEKLAPKK
jgi:hypothetical protein